MLGRGILRRLASVLYTPSTALDSEEDEGLLFTHSTHHSRRDRKGKRKASMADISIEHNMKGRLRAYWLGTCVCMAGFLFGYDSGIVGGVLTLPAFENDFPGAITNTKRTSSLSVSLQQLGAFVACFLAWPITHKLGRRQTLLYSSMVFIVGAILEVINAHSLPLFYVGRVICGLGLGCATVVVPMYSSEMAPPDLRAQIGCFFQFFFTIGILISYWVDYGVKKGVSGDNQMQWQIPIGLQIVPAGILGLGMLTLKDSVRWYMQKGREAEAWESLKWIRASDGPVVQAEMAEIRTGVELEAKARAGFKATELLQSHNFKLISTSFLVFTAQQATGATAFAYFGPQYFALLTGNDVDRNLLLTGIFGAVKVVACGTFVWLLSERFNRRTSFTGGASIMALIFYITAAVVKTHPPPSKADAGGAVSASGKATVALIYLFVIVYNMSWGPLPWPYVSEIFPTRIREPGVAAGVAAQWLFNFLFTLATPYMQVDLGWGTFLVWAVFNTIIAVVSGIFIKETKGKTLEEINAEFSGDKHLLRGAASSGEAPSLNGKGATSSGITRISSDDS